MRKIFLLPLIICSISARSQTGTKHYLGISPAYAVQIGKDQGVSHSTYRGSHFGLALWYEKAKPKRRNSLTIQGITGGWKTLKEGPFLQKSTNHRVQLDHTHSRELVQFNEHLALQLGAAVNFLGHFRIQNNYSNNAYNYDVALSLGLHSLLEYNFRLWGRDFSIPASVDIPLIGYIVRPSFASSIPEGFIAREGKVIDAVLNSGHVAGFGKYARFRFRSGIEYALKNGNGLRLGYSWDFYQMKTFHKVQVGSQTVSFALLFRF